MEVLIGQICEEVVCLHDAFIAQCPKTWPFCKGYTFTRYRRRCWRRLNWWGGRTGGGSCASRQSYIMNLHRQRRLSGNTTTQHTRWRWQSRRGPYILLLAFFLLLLKGRQTTCRGRSAFLCHCCNSGCWGYHRRSCRLRFMSRLRLRMSSGGSWGSFCGRGPCCFFLSSSLPRHNDLDSDVH